MMFSRKIGKALQALLFIIIVLPVCLGLAANDQRIISYIAKPELITLSWKDDNGQVFGSIQNLKTFIEKNRNELIFAMNGGMYRKDYSPQGLYIEKGRLLAPLDTTSASGNFYLKPNGVFFITDENKAFITTTPDFKQADNIKFATQSGPMLLIDGEMHPAFKKGSANLNIRNGVGILPNGDVIFAMSKESINFYDFAEFFKSKNCRNALYLDGFVSRAYIPEQNWKQLDGDFGVIISVSK